MERNQYTVEEYEFLRKVALALIEFRDMHATSDRAKDLGEVLHDLEDMVDEGLDEF